MTSRCGLDSIELSVVSLLSDLEATTLDSVKTIDFLDQLNRKAEIRPSYGYEAVLSMSRDWLINHPLIDFEGNVGSPTDPPADPKYTGVRLSKLGAHVSEAELGNVPPVPFGLVVGDFFAGGSQPAFDARQVSDSLLSLHRDPEIPDDELFELVGLPRFPSGCEVVGDFGALLKGDKVDLILDSSVEQTGPKALEITCVPQEVLNEGTWIDERFARVSGVRSVRNESMRGRYRWAVDVLSDADVADVSRTIAQSWPLRVEVPAHLSAPWRQLASTWLSEFPDDVDLASSLAAIPW